MHVFGPKTEIKTERRGEKSSVIIFFNQRKIFIRIPDTVSYVIYLPSVNMNAAQMAIAPLCMCI
jgi:hypothetical protein